jgi:hypothetical protein
VIEFSVSLIEFVLATLVPIYVGMSCILVIGNVTHLDIRYLSAFALGILFWFLFDTINDAIGLGVNEGYSFDYHQTGLVLLFVAGFIIVTLFSVPSRERTTNNSDISLVLGIITAFGMGIHGFGEGLGFGELAARTQATTVLDAIGGVGGGISYFLHKLLESTIVTVVFLDAARNQGLSIRRQLEQMAIVGLVFGVPSLIGEIVAYYIPIDASYFFAVGAGSAVSVTLLVAKSIFGNSEEDTSYSRWIWISLSVLLGFFLLYGAALFHS